MPVLSYFIAEDGLKMDIGKDTIGFGAVYFWEEFVRLWAFSVFRELIETTFRVTINFGL